MLLGAGHRGKVINNNNNNNDFTPMVLNIVQKFSTHLSEGASCKNICLIRRAVNYSGII